MNLLTTLDTHSSTTIPCQIKLPACMLQCVLVSMRDAWSFRFMWKLESQSGKGESGELSRSIWSKETWRFCSYKRLISPHVLENQKSSWKLKFVLSHTHTHIHTKTMTITIQKQCRSGKSKEHLQCLQKNSKNVITVGNHPWAKSDLLPNHLQPTKKQLPADLPTPKSFC